MFLLYECWLEHVLWVLFHVGFVHKRGYPFLTIFVGFYGGWEGGGGESILSFVVLSISRNIKFWAWSSLLQKKWKVPKVDSRSYMWFVLSPSSLAHLSHKKL